MNWAKDTIRLKVDPLRSIPMHQIVEEVLMGRAGVQRKEIYCIQYFKASYTYDITFVDHGVYEDTLMKLIREAKNLAETGIHLISALCERRLIFVHLYDPFTDLRLVNVFLKQYCSSVKFVGQETSNCGIFTGKWKYEVELMPDLDGCGGAKHPPATFAIGKFRGFLYYRGQPEYCRICHSYGHVKELCRGFKVCRNCHCQGHEAAVCPKPKRCDLCGREGHMAKGCVRINEESGEENKNPREWARQNAEAYERAERWREEAAQGIVEREEEVQPEEGFQVPPAQPEKTYTPDSGAPKEGRSSVIHVSRAEERPNMLQSEEEVDNMDCNVTQPVLREKPRDGNGGKNKKFKKSESPCTSEMESGGEQSGRETLDFGNLMDVSSPESVDRNYIPESPSNDPVFDDGDVQHLGKVSHFGGTEEGVG